MHCLSLIITAVLISPSSDSLRVCELPTHSASADSALASRPDRLVLADAQDGQFNELSLLEAALLAGGSADPQETRKFKRRFDIWANEAISAAAGADDEADTMQRIFEQLHSELLTGEYQTQCSDPAVTLRSGDYNCVSATILYLAALRAAGLQAEAYSTVGHVFCRVGKQELEVETTCDRWFRLSQREARRVGDGARSTGGRVRHNARKLSDVELIAKIFYNRGVACFRQHDFERGMRLTRRSLQLDPHDDVARGNVLAGLNNWSLSLCRQEKFDRAAELLDELEQLDGSYPTLDENRAHLRRLWEKQQLQQADSDEPISRVPQG